MAFFINSSYVSTVLLLHNLSACTISPVSQSVSKVPPPTAVACQHIVDLCPDFPRKTLSPFKSGDQAVCSLDPPTKQRGLTSIELAEVPGMTLVFNDNVALV